MNPKISIIVPVYNVEQYLYKCIESITNQTFKEFELILVNDGSTDKSLQICNRYKEVDKRIRVIDKKNGGVSSARNSGIEIAKGEYIAFVDPDDDIEIDMYETLITKSMETDSDITQCSYKIINLLNNIVEECELPFKENITVCKDKIETELIPKVLSLKTCWGYGIYSTCNKLYKKNVFEKSRLKFDEKKHHGEDARLNLILLTKVRSISFIKRPMYNYYIRERASLTNQIREDLYDYILDNNKFHRSLCNQYKCIEYVDKGIRHYMNTTMQYMISISNSNFNIGKKNEIIGKIINDMVFQEHIKEYKCPNKFQKVLKFVCIKKSSISFILLIYMLNIKQKLNFFNKKVN